MDEEKARLIRPKLEALKAFIRNLSSVGHYLPDNETRRNYRAMYDDIRDTLDDPNLETYAPPLPHLGTTGDRSRLWPEHQARILESGSRLITYLEAQLSEVAAINQTERQPLRCFLIYRFDERGEGYAIKVRTFLELLGIGVISGDRFEPRSVSEKIGESLSGDLHFGVLIISGEGESMWTRDEANTFWAHGKYVIVLVEKGAEFSQGLQADLEWIPFSRDHISDAFSKLVQGIQFIRSKLLILKSH